MSLHVTRSAAYLALNWSINATDSQPNIYVSSEEATDATTTPDLTVSY